MLQRLLPLWLILLCAAAFFWGRVSRHDPFVFSKPYLNYLVAVVMFAIGWMLPRDEIAEVVRRWPAVLFGVALQYGSMPLLSFLCAKLFHLQGDMLIGAIIVGCVPGAMASNVITLLARGNVSYSVSMTTLATLVAPLTVPLGLYLLLGRGGEFPINQIWQLVWMLVLPVSVGFLLARQFPRWENRATQAGTAVANLAILWIIAVVVADNRARLSQFEWRVLAALAALNVLGYLAGYLGGRLMRMPPPMVRAITLEIGMQNAGLGVVLTGMWFPGHDAAAIPPAIYTFGCMFTGTILARAMAMFDRESVPESCSHVEKDGTQMTRIGRMNTD
ncbi:MAG: bile acid:sodium symporter family protein [Planctomycetia bacterium]|nr:bile acid:sodium symporter family protein [Planctomycetia bacterium]